MTNNIKTTGADIGLMADLTSTARMQHAVAFEPDIMCAIQVLGDLKLEDAASAMINEDYVFLSDLEISGHLNFQIPEDGGLACLVIRMEPFYFFKLTGGRYE